MKAKLVILVIIILILGFFLGMLTSAQLRLRKLEPVRTYFSAERFREGFYKIVEPDDDQKVKIDQVFSKYEKMYSELHFRIRKEIDSNFKAMRKELDSVLTREQLDRLKAMDKRRQEMMRHDMNERRNDTLHFKSRRRPSQRGHMPPPPHFGETDTTSLSNSK